MPKPRKRFGQHFLHDQSVITRMLQAIRVTPDDDYLEIGPGRGALTYPLLQQCKKLTAVELDRDLIPILSREAPRFGELDIINTDVLQFELDSLASTNPWRIVGNLPYNISTPLMFHLLESVERIKDMHFMVQKEVAQRIVATVGDKHYGRLSIMIQNLCDCQYLFEVSPQSFKPPPKVDSAIIRLTPRSKPAYQIKDMALFSSVVQTAFSQRRKTIANSLKPLVDSPEVFEACGIDRKSRAENLTGADYAAITTNLLSRNNNEST